jgi:hypothetical protein
MHVNGFNPPHDPVLDPIDSVRCMDAILDTTDPAHPAEPEWPEADFIVGNPPFLGGKLLRTNLGDEYVDGMFKVWGARVPPPADLCCYWFEKGRQMIERRKAIRVGLLATQGIRGGANREVLKRIKDSGDIFFAESDRDWILDGANVHVSMVGFDDGKEATHILDGASVATITRGWLRRMRSARRSSRNERSQIYITNAKLGSNWRIGNSTRQSSRPTAGPLI